MTTRREFLGSIGLPAAAIAAGAGFAMLRRAEAMHIAAEIANHPGDDDAIAQDEDFWARVQQAFTVDRSLVNLNNGGVSPSPALVQDAMKRHLDFSNMAPVYAMWRILEPQREAVRQRLARRWGVDSEEIALTRNASEGLQICQFGVDLKSGDEILTTTQDYPRMLTTFRQRERRDAPPPGHGPA